MQAQRNSQTPESTPGHPWGSSFEGEGCLPSAGAGSQPRLGCSRAAADLRGGQALEGQRELPASSGEPRGWAPAEPQAPPASALEPALPPPCLHRGPWWEPGVASKSSSSSVRLPVSPAGARQCPRVASWQHRLQCNNCIQCGGARGRPWRGRLGGQLSRTGGRSGSSSPWPAGPGPPRCSWPGPAGPPGSGR